MIALLAVDELAVERGEVGALKRVSPPVLEGQPIGLVGAVDLIAAEVHGVGDLHAVLQAEVVLPVIRDLIPAIFRGEGQDSELLTRVARAEIPPHDLTTAEVLLPKAGIEGEADPFLVKGAMGLDVHEARYGFPGHAGEDGLVHRQLSRNHRRETVEARNAAIFCARYVDAVESNRGVAEGGTAQIHVARLALVSLDGHPGNTGEGVGEVLIGKAPDGVSADGVGHIQRVPLSQDGCGFRLLDGFTQYDDLLDHGFRAGMGRSGEAYGC